MKILRPFTGTGAVFWPIGPPPLGTCEFHSDVCKKYCYAAVQQFPDFDEQLLVDEHDKQKIHREFITKPTQPLVRKIMQELDGLQTNILHWFGTGDCPTKNVDKVCDIISSMSPAITQMGFTRNEELWQTYPNIFALSLDNYDEIQNRKGLFSVADYQNGTSRMYRDNIPTRGGLCGPELCTDIYDGQLTHFINCSTCYRLGTGCFFERQ